MAARLDGSAARWDVVHPAEEAVVVPFPLHRIRARERMLARRRRAAAVGLVLSVAAGILLAGGGGTPVTSRPNAPAGVTLDAGDTLWGLARAYAAPGVDPRAYVDELVVLNDLQGPPQRGQRISLPR